jgi:pilus assembly protein CpaB
MILMGLAIACGLGASYMTSRLLADRVEPEKEMVDVVVAKKNLSVGQYIAKPEEFFEIKAIPKETDKMENIRSMDALKGKILKQARGQGETVSAMNLFDKNESLAIPAGYQAIGLRVNLETSASGLSTLPHSRVDVLFTRRGNTLEESATHYLLQHVLVLAADGKIERDGVTAVAQVVTLAVTPKDAQRLTLAKDLGVINLVLRNHGDDVIRDEQAINGKDLFQNKSGDEQHAEAAPPPVQTKVEPKVIAQNPPKDVTPPPVVEPIVPDAPKGTLIHLDINNGSRHSRYSARIDDDNRIIEDIEATPAQAPAQPQRKLQRQTTPDL